MKWKRPKHLGWIITGIVVVGFVVVSLLPKPTKVETATARRTLLRQTIDAEGRVRFVQRYVVSMPATGTLERITLEPGDSVTAGTTIAYFTPPELDPRQRIEARARAEAASSTVTAARQQLAALEPLLEQNRRRDERLQRLVANGAVAREQAENAHDAYMQTKSEIEGVKARIAAASYEAQAARAVVSSAPGQRIPILAPVDGVVLRRYEENARTIMAGTPIMEIGDPSKQEIVIDVLSTDAVKVRPGAHVLVTGWGGADTLRARVVRIEPAARVKVSSLGVEEKRVDIIAVLETPSAALGDAYKVDAGIVLLEQPNALTVPLGALVREGDAWYVFSVDNGTARKRTVTLGARSALLSSIADGLADGETVILHPPEALEDGALVE